jgi:YfiH family protein
MNVSYGVGDSERAVAANRQRIGELIGFPVFLSAKQIHDTGIYCLTKPLTGSLEVEGVDALITDQQGVGLMIQQADCQAVLLFDPVKNIIAALHCGWRGSVVNIIDKVISRMKTGFGVVPGQLEAVISPSLGPCCSEFINYHHELPDEFMPFMVRPDYFDFWQISKNQLIGSGVQEAKINVAGICTCCSENYFSYRRASRLSNGVTGRNCSVIGMDIVD